jgi:hypothetical protein
VNAGEPISYLALENGTPVLSSSGSEFGTVVHVLQIPELCRHAPSTRPGTTYELGGRTSVSDRPDGRRQDGTSSA